MIESSWFTNRPTQKNTNAARQTPQTHRQDRSQYTASQLAHSVMILLITGIVVVNTISNLRVFFKLMVTGSLSRSFNERIITMMMMMMMRLVLAAGRRQPAATVFGRVVSWRVAAPTDAAAVCSSPSSRGFSIRCATTTVAGRISIYPFVRTSSAVSLPFRRRLLGGSLQRAISPRVTCRQAEFPATSIEP